MTYCPSGSAWAYTGQLSDKLSQISSKASKGMIWPSALEGRLPKCVNLQFQPDGIHSPPGEAMFMGDSSNGLLG